MDDVGVGRICKEHHTAGRNIVYTEQWIALAYIFIRLSPITLVAPVIFFARIPMLVRAIFTLVYAMLIVSSLSANELQLMPDGILVNVLLSEFFLGVVLALSFHAANAALNMVSQLIDIQIGISAGASFDPINYQTNSPIGILMTLIAVSVFFSTDLHYQFLYAFGEIFRVLPPGVEYSLGERFFKSISSLFALGLIIASPVIIVMWLVDVALALISRSLPQAQIYFVAMPLKIIIGFLILGLTISLSHVYFYELLSSALESWDTLEKN